MQIQLAGDSADEDFTLAGTPAQARKQLTIKLAPAASRGVRGARRRVRLRDPLKRGSGAVALEAKSRQWIVALDRNRSSSPDFSL